MATDEKKKKKGHKGIIGSAVDTVKGWWDYWFGSGNDDCADDDDEDSKSTKTACSTKKKTSTSTASATSKTITRHKATPTLSSSSKSKPKPTQTLESTQASTTITHTTPHTASDTTSVTKLRTTSPETLDLTSTSFSGSHTIDISTVKSFDPTLSTHESLSTALSTFSTTSTLPGASASAAPGTYNHTGVRGNFGHVMIFVAIGLAISLLVYCFVVVEIKAIQFARNVLRLMFSRGSSFAADKEMGLTSVHFNLDENIERADTRHGLNRWGKIKILWYMFVYSETFDEARVRMMYAKFASFGISPEGEPMDPKFLKREPDEEEMIGTTPETSPRMAQATWRSDHQGGDAAEDSQETERLEAPDEETSAEESAEEEEETAEEPSAGESSEAEESSPRASLDSPALRLEHHIYETSEDSETSSEDSDFELVRASSPDLSHSDEDFGNDAEYGNNTHN